MAVALDEHPHARAVLAPALSAGRPSHAYLFHGPGGAGKRRLTRLIAADLLAENAADPGSARARAISGAHPDLTWVAPSGAHEILVSDIDAAVVAAATRTPFEATRRVFVIDGADSLGEAAANRLLKTLEEPPAYVHLILIADRPAEVMATIASRCQLVRFDGPSPAALAAELAVAGVPADTAAALARLSLGDANVARELASPAGAELRAAAERFAVIAIAGESAATGQWRGLLEAVRARGEAVAGELAAAAEAELAIVSRRDRTRVGREWEERTRRVRRRVETAALGLALTLIEAWLLDGAALAWGAVDQVRNRDRLDASGRLSVPAGERPAAGLPGPAAAAAAVAGPGGGPRVRGSAGGGGVGADAGGGPAPERLIAAVAEVEATRITLVLNVNEDLALEALAYRIEDALSR